MTSFLYKHDDNTGTITNISAGFNAFSSVGVGVGGADVVHFPNSTVLKTEDGQNIKCEASQEVFQAFLKRIEIAQKQTKALDISKEGLDRMIQAFKNPSEWDAFLEEHAPANNA